LDHAGLTELNIQACCTLLYSKKMWQLIHQAEILV
jgi:hypothetical protein